MVDKSRESRWFKASTLFLVIYCSFLFLFRAMLISIEPADTNLLKPEISQIIMVGFLILLYYFAFLGIFVFSLSGSWQTTTALILAVLITSGLFYGFYKWYDLLTNNPFLSFNNYKTLPWYAQEKTKFMIANIPLMLFFATVFAVRFMAITSQNSAGRKR